MKFKIRSSAENPVCTKCPSCGELVTTEGEGFKEHECDEKDVQKEKTSYYNKIMNTIFIGSR